MTAHTLLAVAVVVVTCMGLARAATYETCGSGSSVLTITDYDKQPVACREGPVLSLTNVCLKSITVNVTGCSATEVSNVEPVPNGFPCDAPVFVGNLTAPNALSLRATVSTSPSALQSVAAFCSANAASCSTLSAYSAVNAALWREGDVVYLAINENCTFTYKITSNPKLLNADGKAPAGFSRTSSGGTILMTTSPATSPATAASAPPTNTSKTPSSACTLSRSLLLLWLVAASLLMALAL